MAALEAAIQPPRVCAANNVALTARFQFDRRSLLGPQTLARWVAGSRPAMEKLCD
jgi:hypothetical protein